MCIILRRKETMWTCCMMHCVITALDDSGGWSKLSHATVQRAY